MSILQLQTKSACRGQLKCDGTRAETRFRLSAKWTSPFKSAGASVQSTTGSRGVRISGSNAGYTMFRGSVKGTRYPLHSPVSLSLPLPCVTVCHHIFNWSLATNLPTYLQSLPQTIIVRSDVMSLLPRRELYEITNRPLVLCLLQMCNIYIHKECPLVSPRFSS